MSRFVKMKEAGSGADIYINPEFVAVLAPNGVAIGESKMMLSNGAALAISGNPETVRGVLLGGNYLEG